MKPILLLGTLLAAILAAGCEMIANTDHSQVIITDGNVTSFQTQQDNVVIDFNPGQQRLTNSP